MKKYDLIVIGGGGGTKVSTPASKLGKKVAIIEKEALGGTCLNRGCIPSKMLIHPANVFTAIKDAQKYGVTGQEHLQADFSALVQRVSAEIDAESASIGTGYESNENLEYYHGAAQFVEDKVVEVNGEQLTADTIVIATGSTPAVPPIPGLEGTPYMTSREALRNEQLPKKLLVIGGGYIACELGSMYGAFGAETVFFVRGQYLDREDHEVQATFQAAFEKRHQTHYGFSDLSVAYDNGIFTLSATGAEGQDIVEESDALLVATGVKPLTAELGLENTDITLNERGYITVDDHLQTTVPGVYAIGDCIGRYLFRHSVNFEGEYLFDQLFGAEAKAPISYPPMPHAVFSHPEIGGVGKTEDELKADGVDYLSIRHDYKNSAQGMARLPEEGFVKLLFDRKTQQLLGAHIIGDEASIMVHQLIYAITHGATPDDLLRMIYIHPALPEVIRNAARKAREELRKS